MILPILPIFAKAVVKAVVSKLNPKAKTVPLVEAVVGEVAVRLVPKSVGRAQHDGFLAARAGAEFGKKLRDIIKGKYETLGETTLGRFLRAAGEELDPQ